MKCLLAGLAAVAVLGACNGKPPRPQGGLVIVLETDLSLPQDFDRVKLTVQQRDRVLLSEEHAVGPGRLLVPAEFRAPSPGNDAPTVVRAVAYKGTEPRIERSAITPIPSAYLGLVRLPLNYLCDGTASHDGSSTCGTQSTCKQGSCRTATVPTG